MSLQLNDYRMAGNLAADPEFRAIANDRRVCNFTVITNRRWKNADGTTGEEATAIRWTAWDKLADFVAGHFAKGQAIYAGGRLRLETWVKDGQTHSRIVGIADDVRFVQSAAHNVVPPAAAPAPSKRDAFIATLEASPAAPASTGGDNEPPF